VEAVARLIKQQSPRQIFVPSRRDGLPDHVATFEIVCRALKLVGKPVEVFEYPVWLWQTWPWSSSEQAIPRSLRALAIAVRNTIELVAGCRIRVDIRAVRELKLRALGEHRSQMHRPQDDEAWPILADVDSGRFLERLTRDEETFRRTVFRA
jgi:LmbE family N-acetylglucosaminyl deacetylase